MSAFQLILDQCSNIDHLAGGGQKEVFKADHAQYGSVVLKRGHYNSENSLKRIQREVGLLKSLNSFYFPKNYEFIVDPGANEFLILEELLDAEPLSKMMTSFRSEDAAIGLLRQLIEGLEFIWNLRIVHRDLKPANILIANDLSPRIIDFGIARFLDESSLTRTIAFQGPATPRYAAPEQLLNKKDEIGVRADFFALGIITAELCLGFHPFDAARVGNRSSIPENIKDGQFYVPSSKDGVSDNFTALIQRLLQTEPYKRFRSPAVLKTFIDTNWNQLA